MGKRFTLYFSFPFLAQSLYLLVFSGSCRAIPHNQFLHIPTIVFHFCHHLDQSSIFIEIFRLRFSETSSLGRDRMSIVNIRPTMHGRQFFPQCPCLDIVQCLRERLFGSYFMVNKVYPPYPFHAIVVYVIALVQHAERPQFTVLMSFSYQFDGRTGNILTHEYRMSLFIHEPRHIKCRSDTLLRNFETDGDSQQPSVFLLCPML